MKDIILYIKNLEDFRAEGQARALTKDPLFSFNDGKLVFNVEKIPVKYNENESICLVKILDSDVDRINSIKRLGVCVDKEYIFDSEECEAIYDRVNGPLEFTDSEGEKHFKPKIIGVFA